MLRGSALGVSELRHCAPKGDGDVMGLRRRLLQASGEPARCDPRLGQKLRPDRAHTVSEDFDWLLESNYEPKWPETFVEKQPV